MTAALFWAAEPLPGRDALDEGNALFLGNPLNPGYRVVQIEGAKPKYASKATVEESLYIAPAGKPRIEPRGFIDTSYNKPKAETPKLGQYPTSGVPSMEPKPGFVAGQNAALLNLRSAGDDLGTGYNDNLGQFSPPENIKINAKNFISLPKADEDPPRYDPIIKPVEKKNYVNIFGSVDLNSMAGTSVGVAKPGVSYAAAGWSRMPRSKAPILEKILDAMEVASNYKLQRSGTGSSGQVYDSPTKTYSVGMGSINPPMIMSLTNFGASVVAPPSGSPGYRSGNSGSSGTGDKAAPAAQQSASTSGSMTLVGDSLVTTTLLNTSPAADPAALGNSAPRATTLYLGAAPQNGGIGTLGDDGTVSITFRSPPSQGYPDIHYLDNKTGLDSRVTGSPYYMIPWGVIKWENGDNIPDGWKIWGVTPDGMIIAFGQTYSSTYNLSLAHFLFGDDPTTGDIKEGARDGDLISLLVEDDSNSIRLAGFKDPVYFNIDNQNDFEAAIVVYDTLVPEPSDVVLELIGGGFLLFSRSLERKFSRKMLEIKADEYRQRLSGLDSANQII